MFLPLNAQVVAQAVPKTFQDLEVAKTQAFLDLDQFQEDWQIDAEMPQQKLQIHRLTLKCGPKQYFLIEVDGAKVTEGEEDASTYWMVLVQAKKYYQGKKSPAETSKPKASELQPKVGEHEFKFSFDSDKPIQFAANPPLKLESLALENNHDIENWKAVCSGIGKNGNSVRITEWFRKDRWILTRFKLEVQAEEGKSVFTGETTSQRFHCSEDDPRFIFNPASVAGFDELKQGDAGAPQGGGAPAPSSRANFAFWPAADVQTVKWSQCLAQN